MTPGDLKESVTPVTVELEPGFFSEATDRGARGHWKSGDRVRFKNGLPQKIGGWEDTPVTGSVFRGIDRRQWEWTSLDGQPWIAQGTSKKLYVINRGVRYDITPLRLTATLTNPFTTTLGSAVVTVAHVAHGAQDGDFVRFSGATAVGGITIAGEYEINVLNGDAYTIAHTITASSAATGGGTVTAEYDISVGADSTELAHGWGTCVWNDGTWGTPRGDCSGIVRGLRIWSLDNFGEDLIASPRGGAVFHWDRSNGPETRAQLLPNAPRTNQHVLLSNTGNQIICLGAFDDVANTDDRMLVRVSDPDDPFNAFTPTDQNNAFDERLSTGSTIVAGVRTRNGVLISTDTAIYLMQADPNEVFVIDKIAEGNSVIGPNAWIDVNGVIYAMAAGKFMRYDSVYHEMPCAVWSRVFDNSDVNTPGIAIDQGDKVYCWHNKGFSEVWWHYPSSGQLFTEDGEPILTEDGDPLLLESSENDRYVIYNYGENIWYDGSIERTAASTGGIAYDAPYGSDVAGVLFLHETGADDNDAAMNEFIESWDVELGDGADQMHVSEFIPDMKRIVGTLALTLKSKARPQQAAYVVRGPYAFDGTNERVGARAAGRQMAFRLSSSALGTDWRAGKFTFGTQPDAGR